MKLCLRFAVGFMLFKMGVNTGYLIPLILGLFFILSTFGEFLERLARAIEALKENDKQEDSDNLKIILTYEERTI